MLQRIKFKIAIYSLIGVILLTLLGFWVYFSSAQARDYQRMGDLKVWQYVLGDYYSKNGTYIIPYCDIGSDLSKCFKKTIGRRVINDINDPINSGAYRYLIGSMSENDYEINFALEAGIGGLKPGSYILTKTGVRK